MSKRLIYEEDAIDALDIGCELLRRALDDTDVVGVERAKYEWGLGLIESYIADIKELPSAQPEIIRCKDCKHYQFADNRAFGMPVKMCKWFGFEDVDDYDFCSRAERRTDA